MFSAHTFREEWTRTTAAGQFWTRTAPRPSPRDQHLQMIAERDRMAWQKASGYNWRALAEADISRFKRVMLDVELPR